MARNGSVPGLDNLVVQSVFNSATAARLILKKGAWTVTIESTAKLPDDVNPRPGETVDLALSYDPRP